MKTLALALVLAASPLAAQMGDTVQVRPAVHRTVGASVGDSLAAWCAVRWRHVSAQRSVFVDSITPAAVPINPDCGDAAAILLRPACVFAPSEFLELRLRARYVILICEGGRRATGYPLRAASPEARTI